MKPFHVTCVAMDGLGVLLRGVSGSGKSDLALRLIDEGARLVSDDYTRIENDGGKLVAMAPDTIKGLIEVRGIGVVRMDSIAKVNLALLIDLVDAEQIDRLPDKASEEIMGVELPRIAIAPFESSSPAKVRIALKTITDDIMRT